MKPVIDFVVYFVARSFICVIQALSIEACAGCAQTLAYVLNDVLRIRRKVVDDNLKQTFPQLSANERRTISRRNIRKSLSGCPLNGRSGRT